MSTVEITAGTVEQLQVYVQKASDGTALTGSSNLRVEIRRAADDKLLDFADLTFKSSGWTTEHATLTEVSSSNNPGWYKYAGGVNTAGWSADSYFVTFLEVSTTLSLGQPQFATGEIRIVSAKASDLSARLPALVGGRIDASVGAVQSGAIDAAAIASGALTAAKFGAGAITSTVLADNAITSSKIATDAIGAAQIAADAIGASELATGAAQEIADTLLDRALSGHTTSGTAGEALSRLDVAVSTRAAPGAAMDLIDDAVDAGAVAASGAAEIQSGLATASALSAVGTAVATLPSASDAATAVWGAGTRTLTGIGASGIASQASVGALPTAAAIADAVCDEALSGHTTSGSVGEALGRLDATVSSRSTLTASQVWSTALPGAFSSGSAGYLVGTYLDAAVSTRLPTSSYSAAPSASAIATQVLGTAVPGSFASGSLGFIIGTNLDVVVSTRLAGSAYTAPPSASAVAAQVWATAEGTPTSGTFGYGLQLLRMGLTNRLEESAGSPGLLKLYADDATTLFKTWQLRDSTGGAVTAQTGAPSKRGAAT